MESVSVISLVVFSFIFSTGIKKIQFQNKNLLVIVGLCLIGFAVGPNGLNFVNQTALIKLDLLNSVLIGLVGFFVGIEFKACFSDKGLVSNVSHTAFWVFVISTLIFLLAMSFALEAKPEDVILSFNQTFLGQVWTLNVSPIHIWLSLILSSMTMTFSEKLMKKVNQSTKPNSEFAKFAYFNKSIFHFLSIILFGLVLAGSRAGSENVGLGWSVMEWTVLATFFGIFCGGVFALFVGRAQNEERVYLAALGAIVFASGTGQSIGISPIFVNCVFGLTLAIFSDYPATLKKSLMRFLDPIYVMTFLIVSMHYEPQLGWGLYLAGVFFGVRFLTFKAAFLLSSKGDARGVKAGGISLGDGFLSQDLLLLIIAAGTLKRFPEVGSQLISLVLFTVILSQMYGWPRLKKLLVDLGEFRVKSSTSLNEGAKS